MNYAPALKPMCVHEENQLLVHTLIGVYEWEREALRPLVLSLQLHSTEPLNLSRALIEQQLAMWLEPCRYRLLEALAQHLTEQMFAAWTCQKIVLEMEKPGALGDFARVGVCISRVRI
ncbi:MAG: dihydroneopterin aldolase [Gallionella sp.]